MARTKTIRAIATISANFVMGCGEIEYALAGETGQWYMRKHERPANAPTFSTRWAFCESPLEAFGLTPADIEGDVARELPGDGYTTDGENVYGAYITGDIGHRLRLPRSPS